MKFIRLFGTVLLAFGIFCAARMDCLAVQFNYRPVETIPVDADRSDYIALGTECGSYVVQSGDTLWGISRRFWGTGTEYEKILLENQDIISDVHLLMPGDVLTISGSLYIPKDRYDRGGLRSESGFHIASPDMVQHSYFLGNDMDVDDVFPSDISVYSLPVTNTMGENALTASQEDWEAFKEEVIRCGETCGGRVSNLQFEKYTVENGCDLCGYSFDFDMGDAFKEFVVFYRLGERNMVEVIGKRTRERGAEPDTELVDVTRYIAASFEDFGGSVGMGYTKMTDNVGAYDWNYPELHNPFSSAMKNYVVYAAKPDENYPGDCEITWSEPLFEQAVRNALIELWHLTEAEELTMSACGLTDYSFIANMTHLKSLCIVADETVKDIGFLAALGEVRTLQLLGVYSYVEGKPAGFLEITDLSVLKNCKELRYLYLRTPQVTDFSFLKECPEICTMDLSGEYLRKSSVIPAPELLPNARFLDFYGENYRFEP